MFTSGMEAIKMVSTQSSTLTTPDLSFCIPFMIERLEFTPIPAIEDKKNIKIRKIVFKARKEGAVPKDHHPWRFPGLQVPGIGRPAEGQHPGDAAETQAATFPPQ
jgi:hypothetical protein